MQTVLPDEQRAVTVDLQDFIQNHYDGIVRSVTIVCGSVPEAEDAVQHALAVAVEQLAQGRTIDHLPAWVVTVATNHTTRRFRRRATEARSLAQLRPLVAPSPATADYTDLHRAIAALPLRERQAVVLYYLHDLEVATIASAMGVHEGTVKTALFRARRTLAAALALDDEEEQHDA